MSGDSADISRFRALGNVVEIVERGGSLRVVVVLDSGSVVDVPLDGACDLHLGDRVTVEGWLEVNDVSVSGPAGASEAAPRGRRPAAPFTRRWRHDA